MLVLHKLNISKPLVALLIISHWKNPNPDNSPDLCLHLIPQIMLAQIVAQSLDEHSQWRPPRGCVEEKEETSYEEYRDNLEVMWLQVSMYNC